MLDHAPDFVVVVVVVVNFDFFIFTASNMILSVPILSQQHQHPNNVLAM